MKTTTIGDARPTDRSWTQARFLAASAAALLMLLTIGACERADDADSADDQTEEAARFADVGPDWSIVQEYLDWKALPKAGRDAATAETPQEEDAKSPEEAPTEPPDLNRAAAAARAIVDRGIPHPYHSARDHWRHASRADGHPARRQ